MISLLIPHYLYWHLQTVPISWHQYTVQLTLIAHPIILSSHHCVLYVTHWVIVWPPTPVLRCLKAWRLTEDRTNKWDSFVPTRTSDACLRQQSVQWCQWVLCSVSLRVVLYFCLNRLYSYKAWIENLMLFKHVLLIIDKTGCFLHQHVQSVVFFRASMLRCLARFYTCQFKHKSFLVA